MSDVLRGPSNQTLATREEWTRALLDVLGGGADTETTVDADSQAIILAAGRGRRLGAATDDRPKCLTELAGRTLLQRQLELLGASDIERVCVVAGYQAQAVQQAIHPTADVIYNDLWAATDSLYSLWLCRKWVRGPVIIMNCDVVVHPEGIRRLSAVQGNAFVYDSLSGNDPEHMKVELKDGRLTAMSKELPADRVSGENVGVLKFDEPAISLLFQEAGTAITMQGRKPRQAAVAVERLCRFIPIRGVDISHLPWIEIDFPDDLDLARRVTWPAILRQTGLRTPPPPVDRHRTQVAPV